MVVDFLHSRHWTFFGVSGLKDEETISSNSGVGLPYITLMPDLGDWPGRAISRR
jgi:hypothetical protein